MESPQARQRLGAAAAAMRLVAVAVAVVVLLILAPARGLAPARAASAKELPPDNIKIIHPPEIQRLAERVSGMPSIFLARAFGLEQIAGRPVVFGPPGSGKAKRLTDVPVGGSAMYDENEPTVAANPKAKHHLVAGSHHLYRFSDNNQCAAYRSSDGGATWTMVQEMPLLEVSDPSTPSYHGCSDPSIAYAPDGSRAYYVYMDLRKWEDWSNFPNSFAYKMDWDILLSYSDDDGATWAGPIIALDGSPTEVTYGPCPGEPGTYCGVFVPGFQFDKCWVGTHIDEKEANWVYVTATYFGSDANAIAAEAFTRSADKGISFDKHKLFDAVTETTVTVMGSRPVGGIGGEVLVAWYNSGNDNWLNGPFQIRVAHSTDHGASFTEPTTAVEDSFEVPYYLGPFQAYKRWWGAMFPAVAFDSRGAAHIVYTHDPDPDPASPEDGDIRYITSPGPPYAEWTTPVTVNDDNSGRAQGYAAVAVRPDGTVHVIWEDSRLAPDLSISNPDACWENYCSPNLFYDIFYARKAPGQTRFFQNFRLSDTSSWQDWSFAGDYIGLTTTDSVSFGIWTDRRHKPGMYYQEDNVFGSRVIPGGGTPK